jgi:hypothetical protein
VFEVPRNIFVNLAKLGVGVMLPVVGIAPVAGCPQLWSIAMPFVIAGVLLVAGNARAVLERPPLLRATGEGLWFGGGSIIPWHEVASIYYPRVRDITGRPAFQTRELRIAFHRRRTLLATPWTLWFPAVPLGRVAISLETLHGPTRTIVAQLETMRRRACGDDNTMPGRRITKPPVARVVKRSPGPR